MVLASFAERFKWLRESRGWTQDDVAEKLGVSRPTIAGYESESKGRIPREETLIKIAELFNCTTDFLLGRTGDPSPHNRAVNEISQGIFELKGHTGTVFVPLIGSIHAGDPIPPIEEADVMMVPESEIKPGKRYFGLRVKGDCMAYGPHPIHDGDMVLVEERPDVENSHIAVVMLPDEDEAVLRRVYYTREGVILTADNPRYPPIVVRGKDIKIYGQVVNYVSRPAAAKDVRNHIDPEE